MDSMTWFSTCSSRSNCTCSCVASNYTKITPCQNEWLVDKVIFVLHNCLELFELLSLQRHHVNNVLCIFTWSNNDTDIVFPNLCLSPEEPVVRLHFNMYMDLEIRLNTLSVNCVRCQFVHVGDELIDSLEEISCALFVLLIHLSFSISEFLACFCGVKIGLFSIGIRKVSYAVVLILFVIIWWYFGVNFA